MQKIQSQHHYSFNSSTGKWTLASTTLASSMAFIDSTALNVILPSLQQDLNASATDLFWVLNSYLLMLAALIILGGSLGDKLGRVRIFKWGIIIFTIASVLCALSPTIHFLIILRGLQGIGGALMIPGSLAIISSIFKKEERGKAIGTWSAITTVVTICGPILGGTLADLGLWRLIFYINVPLGIVSWLILQFKVPESKQSNTSKIDLIGAITMVIGLTSLTFGFLQIPELGVTHPLVIGSLTLGLATLGIFTLIEMKVENPILPFRLFKNKTFLGVNLLSFFLYGALGALMLFLSLNIIQIQGYSQKEAGLTFLPFSLIMLLLARRMGSLTDQFGPRPFLILGPTIAGIGMTWLATIGMTEGPSDYWTTYLPGMTLFAIGMSITVVPLTTTVMNAVDENESGVASGINNSVTRIAATMANAIFGAIAVFYFTILVSEQITPLTLITEASKEMIIDQTTMLGGAQVPNIISKENTPLIQEVYTTSFLHVYKRIGFICAFLAFTSAAIAAVTVSKKKK